jgi:NAD(P)H-dependent FMN reductase
MPKILAISGSLRARSYNTWLLRAAAAAAPAGTILDVGSIRDIPIYDADVDAGTGSPQSVRDLKERLAAADGLLLATPEYNHSIPGGLKNAIDWMSRPASDIPRVFGGRPIGVIGATTGQGGTIVAQEMWLPVIRALGMLPFFAARVTISNAARVFDEEGRIQDPAVHAQVERYIGGFARFVERAAMVSRI